MASSKLYVCRLAMALLAVTAIASSLQSVLAADEDPLQDTCVAMPGTPTINGFPCKASPMASDFMSPALAKKGDTNNRNKAAVTPLTVDQFAGLNTLGISGVRIDFEAGGLNQPHTHPRATELLFLIYGGPLEVGFVSSNGNTLFQQTIYAGDVFVFPRGLLHFQKNPSTSQPAVAVAALNSQKPGVQQAAQALFNATTSTIPVDVLAQTLGVSEYIVEELIKAAK